MNKIKYFLQFLLLLFLCTRAVGQVPVREEPHHKPVLENDYIRLLDVHINAGDTTQYHIHAVPSVIVFISKSVIGAQIMGKAADATSEVLPGQTRFIAYDKNPVTHRVFNAGNNIFHVMDIELVRNGPSPDSCSTLQQANIETTINEKLVRAYKFDAGANQSLKIDKSSCAHLLICINGEISSSSKTIKAGEYIFFNPMNEILLTNKQNNVANCVLLELK